MRWFQLKMAKLECISSKRNRWKNITSNGRQWSNKSISIEQLLTWSRPTLCQNTASSLKMPTLSPAIAWKPAKICWSTSLPYSKAKSTSASREKSDISCCYSCTLTTRTRPSKWAKNSYPDCICWTIKTTSASTTSPRNSITASRTSEQ